MRFALAVACLTVLLIAVVGVLGTGRRRWGVFLLVVSVAWLPLNNAAIEGPVLIGVSAEHGFTTADVLGLTGITIAGFAIWPPRRWRSPGWVAARAAVLVLAAAAGFALAYVDTVERVDRQLRQVQLPQRTPGLQAAGLPSPDKERSHGIHSPATAGMVTVGS